MTKKTGWKVRRTLTYKHKVATLFAIALLCTASASAQESASHAGSATAHAPVAHGSHHFHQNEFGLFLGGTREGAVDESFFTIGGEYERRFTEHFGLSMVAEYITDADAWVVVFPFTLRPVSGYGLKLFVGPGFQNKPPHHHAVGHGGDEHDEHGESHAAAALIEPTAESKEGRDTHFLLRVGGGYSFEFGGRYTLTPTLALDLTHENEEWEDGLLFGVGFGVAF